VRRDKHGIIIQTSRRDHSYESGGDSSFSTGIYALAGSSIDAKLMPMFIVKDHKLVRHAFQTYNNSALNTSRDQAIAFFSGLPELRKQIGTYHNDYILVQTACIKYAESYFINKDILLPNIKHHFYRCAGVSTPSLILFFAYLIQPLSILWDAFVKPNHEMNQSICVNISFGKTWLKILYKLHPNLLANVTEYYSGWRDMKEIGEALNETIKKYVLH
jgi:hypothetical protein